MQHNLTTGINESRALAKHTSCKCECNFESEKCNSNQKWNANKSWSGCKNLNEHRVCKKDCFGILQHVAGNLVNM